MRVYIEFMKNTMQSNMAYKFNTFLDLFGHMISLSIQVSIWRALFKGAVQVSTNTGFVTINEMITYVIISTIMSVVISSDAIGRISSKISSGEVAIDLIRPINFMAYAFSEMLGNMSFRFIFQILPLSILGISIWGVNYPSFYNALLFSIALVNAIFIHFLLTYTIGLLGFWYLRMWHLRYFVGALIMLFSGAYIPLWFFPKVLLDISNVLPFRLIYFAPLSIFLGKVEYMESVKLILLQAVWIMILFVAQRIVWHRGVEKLVIQGG